MKAADFDQDGYPDLAVLAQGAGFVNLAIGRGDGSFHPALGYVAGQQPQDLAVGDVDGDGRPDAIVATASPGLALHYLPGLASGGLGAPQLVDAGFAASSVVAGDLDGDGQLDLVVADEAAGQLRVHMGLGGGVFDTPKTLATLPGPRALTLADVQGDGLLDLVVPSPDTNAVAVHRGQGNGLFGPPLAHAIGGSPRCVVVGDLDGDELVDLAVARAGNTQLMLLAGQMGGTFAPAVSMDIGGSSSAMGLADLDGDYLTDLLVTDDEADSLALHVNQIGPWVDVGAMLPGEYGELELSATGTPAPDADCTLSVTARTPGAPPAGHGTLFAGFSSLQQPFFGGTLVPAPESTLAVQPDTQLPFRWPDGLAAGSSVYVQAWFPAGTPGALSSATNALRAVVQSD